MVTLETILTCNTRAQSYRVKRGATTYYMVDDFITGSVYVSQVYVSKLGRRGERRLPDGKVRDELVAALQEHKAKALRERLGTPVTMEQAGRLAAAS
jgi:hypothetical protein